MNKQTLLLAAILMLCSCKGTKTLPAVPASVQVEGRTWVLSLINDQVNPTTPEGNRIRLVLNPNHVVTGFNGCNDFTGKYTMGADSIRFSDFISTEKACPETQLHREFMYLLTLVNRYSFREQKLILQVNRKVLLEFDPQ